MANVFVGSLALTDLLISLMVAPMSFAVDFIHNNNTMWTNICSVKEITGLICIGGELSSILLIAVDRFIFIHDPLHYYLIMTTRKAITIVISLWMGNISLEIFTAIFGFHVTVGIICDYSNILSVSFYYGLLVPYFGICSLGTLIIYTKMGYLVWRKAKEIRCHEVGHQGPCAQQPSSQMKITKTMGLILGLYFVSF